MRRNPCWSFAIGFTARSEKGLRPKAVFITRYGIDVIGKVILILLLLNAATFALVEAQAVRFGVPLVSLAILLFTLYFFRDPERKPPAGDNLVLAPGDGKVVLIKDVEEDEFLQQRAHQISIFLSPLDVHVNRFPIAGKVKYYKYVRGKYIVAFDDKASEANERTHIGIENGRAKVLFKQIAGFLARRIVAEVEVGMDAAAGERFGMIKFGSRIDVFVPHTAEVKVRVDDRVVGGETILAIVP